ncbi:hypothetical protein [Sphingomonas sp.]|uniref:hypothetical protein n=1 Tax=Sphingomonas sp. TaxID=28214 RepID=UPI0025E5A581|nr:hypothetical protein [Sphingomonas sp.]MBV9527308.1 hypothetical protein [Sphingomonas sp.]
MSSNPSIVRYLNPWKARREEREQRIAELRTRDGDACRRCRRPIRFDLPVGHDQGPRIEDVVTLAVGAPRTIGNQCLCHGRCNGVGADHTSEVQERRRRSNEADLFARSRRQA